MISLIRRWALIRPIALLAGCVPVDEGVTVSGTIAGWYQDIVVP